METSRWNKKRAEDLVPQLGQPPPVGGVGYISPWWGIVYSCDYEAGTVMVKSAYGTLGSLVANTVDAVECYQGDGWHVVGDEVFVLPSGPGVTPEWTIDQRIGGARAWTPPTEEELADIQDDPSEVSDCGVNP